MDRDNPYRGLPQNAFWRTAVSEADPQDHAALIQPKYTITKDMVVATAGSCFAQHITRELKQRQLNFLDVEKPPPGLPQEQWASFGYGLYSARYGNVYSPRQLLQLFRRAYGKFTPSEAVWRTNGRYYDPYRPSIEPDGFGSFEEVTTMRDFHLESLRKICRHTELFIFTFGLTEAWVDSRDGAVYPSCPGTIAGSFDPDRHQFHNFSFSETMADMEAFIAFIKVRNPAMRFLFTVSPVPLTATASGQHVLTASMYSKSVLRAVCGELYTKYDYVDYFPSYEIISGHPSRAVYFNDNMRTVSEHGVRQVMDLFSAAHQLPGAIAVAPSTKPANIPPPDEDDVICDDEILEAFRQ